MISSQRNPQRKWPDRGAAGLLLALLAPVSAFAQEGSDAGSSRSDEVAVIRAWNPSQALGTPSRGMHFEDSQIPVRVDGNLEVAFLREGEERQSSAAPRDLLVFVDEGSALPAQRDAFLSALAARLEPSLPGRRLALVVADRNRIEVVLPWTESSTSITRGLDEMAKRRVFGLELRSRKARTAAYRMRGDRGTGSTSFAAVGFSGSGRKAGAPGNRSRDPIERRVERSAAQAAASLLLYPEAFGLEREDPSVPMVMVLVGGMWGSADDSPSALDGLIYGAQRGGVALFPWRGGDDPTQPSPTPGLEAGEVLAAATGGRVLAGHDDSWDVLEAAGTGVSLELELPRSPDASSSDGMTVAEVELLWPEGLAPELPDRWLLPSPSWRAGWRTVMAHLAGEVMPSAGLTVRLGEAEERRPNRTRVPLQLEIPLQDVALVQAGDCRVGRLEVRIAAEDPWRPVEELVATSVEVNRLGPRVAGEVELWEGAITVAPTRQRLLVSVFDPGSGGLWTREVVFEP